MKRYETIGKAAEELMKRRKTLAERDFLIVQSYAMLSLFVLIAPRRNLDYQVMMVVKKMPDTMDPGKNYYVVSEKKMLFNRYKTAKTHGQQTVYVPPELERILKEYLKHTSQWRASLGKAPELPLFTNYLGAPLATGTAIQRLLAVALGKVAGSSMLRHSYLTHKYGAVTEEMMEMAEAMAHTSAVQKTYIRKPAGADTIDLVGGEASSVSSSDTD
jgi:integrase